MWPRNPGVGREPSCARVRGARPACHVAGPSTRAIRASSDRGSHADRCPESSRQIVSTLSDRAGVATHGESPSPLFAPLRASSPGLWGFLVLHGCAVLSLIPAPVRSATIRRYPPLASMGPPSVAPSVPASAPVSSAASPAGDAFPHWLPTSHKPPTQQGFVGIDADLFFVPGMNDTSGHDWKTSFALDGQVGIRF